jgi:hypothetical protein
MASSGYFSLSTGSKCLKYQAYGRPLLPEQPARARPDFVGFETLRGQADRTSNAQPLLELFAGWLVEACVPSPSLPGILRFFRNAMSEMQLAPTNEWLCLQGQPKLYTCPSL